MIMAVRRWVYRHGYRPRPGTILYSPSLALSYSFAGGLEALAQMWAMALAPVIEALAAVSEPPRHNPRLFADPPLIVEQQQDG